MEFSMCRSTLAALSASGHIVELIEMAKNPRLAPTHDADARGAGERPQPHPGNCAPIGLKNIVFCIISFEESFFIKRVLNWRQFLNLAAKLYTMPKNANSNANIILSHNFLFI